LGRLQRALDAGWESSRARAAPRRGVETPDGPIAVKKVFVSSSARRAGRRTAPELLTQQYNAAVADKRAVEAELEARPGSGEPVTTDEVRQTIAGLGDLAEVLASADRQALADLYQAMKLSVTYDHQARAADVSVSPTAHGAKVCVRGGLAP
jgi:hypothetical protein